MNYLPLIVAVVVAVLSGSAHSLDMCRTSFRVQNSAAAAQRRLGFSGQGVSRQARQLPQGPQGPAPRPGQPQGPPGQQGQQGPNLEFIETTTLGSSAEYTLAVWVYHDVSECETDVFRISLQTPTEEEIQQDPAGDEPVGAMSLLVRYGPDGVAVSVDEEFGLHSVQTFMATPGDAPLAAGWHHLALSWSNLIQCGELNVYIDGQVVGTRDMPLQFNTEIRRGTLSAVINRDLLCDYTLQFTGIQMFGRVLSPQEILSLAQCALPAAQQEQGDLVSYQHSTFERNEVVGPRGLEIKRPVGLPAQCCPTPQV